MKFIFILFFLFGWNSLNAQVKIGVVDSQKVLKELSSKDSLIIEIERLRNEYNEDLRVFDSLIENKSSKPVDYGCCIEPSENIRLRFQREKTETESTLNALSEKWHAKTSKKIKAASEIVASSMGIDLIVDESVMLYYEDKIDITQQVINELVKPAK